MTFSLNIDRFLRVKAELVGKKIKMWLRINALCLIKK
jgi:hypothetical protein